VISLPAEITTTLLSVLWDEADRRDRRVREALFLTFNVDLGFFESQILGAARSAGAAVTVIADAKVYEPDPRAIRAAGIHYGIGLASMNSVFHPKLMVLAGEDRAVIGIGSGNLTIGGWHLNDEVLTVVAGDAETGCPSIIQEVASWLAELAGGHIVKLGRTARAGIGRTAEQLQMLCASAPTTADQLRLVGNLRASILSQLPRDPVDELRLFAPFHDLAGVALDELVATIKPSAVVIAVQDGTTVIDPHTLLEVARRRGVELIFERAAEKSEGAYRHGKIIEARRQGSLCWTLAGSVNLSRQALCRSAADGGNCELAVLDQPGRALYPPTTGEAPVAELKVVRKGPPSAEEEPAARVARDGLLEATLHGEVITLTFARSISDGFRVAISDYRTDPDQFTVVTELEPGRAEYSVPANSDWSYPLRLRIIVDGEAGPIHFVMRSDQVVLRSIGRGGVRTPDFAPEQIFADYRQAREWLSAVNELSLHSQSARRGPGIAHDPADPRSPSGGHAPSWDDPATWHAYVDDATLRLGESMVGFALGGLPRLSFPAAGGRAAWEDDFATGAELVEEDEEHSGPQTEHSDEDGRGKAPRPDGRDFGRTERQRFRRWLVELVDPMPRLGAIDRALRARLMLRATCMKIWEPDIESQWFELLLSAARALPGGDTPPQDKPRLGALAQVMIYELALAARAIGFDRSVENKSAMAAYLEVERQLHDLLIPVERSLIETFTETVHVKGAIRLDSELVALHAAGALGNDAITLALRELMLTYPEVDAERLGENVISVHTSDANPLLAAGRCADAVGGSVAVFASSRSGRRAFVARAGSTVITAEGIHSLQAGASTSYVRFRSFRLTPFVSATRIAAREGVVLDGDIRAIETPPMNSVGTKGSEVFATLGLQPEKVLRFIYPGEVPRTAPD
jgi:hypothetical protein